jgi:hypothetical protein
MALLGLEAVHTSCLGLMLLLWVLDRGQGMAATAAAVEQEVVAAGSALGPAGGRLLQSLPHASKPSPSALNRRAPPVRLPALAARRSYAALA